ncbi:ABC transporter transmembrane domain-containing protein [Saccharopolyspora sp. 5N708]|uniref:ABC transporter transmembrane domain-containing protein n=1 Tax=Saccharopolyspora sp. 5N708 TaxID=3457424 RepID=UPI003FD65460
MIAIAGAVASFFGGFLSARIAEQFLVRLRARIFGHLQPLPPDFFARHQAGDLGGPPPR